MFQFFLLLLVYMTKDWRISSLIQQTLFDYKHYLIITLIGCKNEWNPDSTIFPENLKLSRCKKLIDFKNFFMNSLIQLTLKLKSPIVNAPNIVLPYSSQIYLALKFSTSVAKKNLFQVTPFSIFSSLVID